MSSSSAELQQSLASGDPQESRTVEPVLDAGAIHAPANAVSKTFAGLTRGDYRFLTLCSAVIFLLGITNLVRLQFHSQNSLQLIPGDQKFQTYQVDVNHATWVEWMQVPEIGEILARKIIAEREQNGPFQSVDDVVRVNGIGRKTLEKIRPHLTHATASR